MDPFHIHGSTVISMIRGYNYINFVGILFPYGEKYGDQLQNSSADQKQLLFSCKYFGVQEDTIYVSYIIL